MPDRARSRLRALLPSWTARDLFDPAWADLEAELYERFGSGRPIGPESELGHRHSAPGARAAESRVPPAEVRVRSPARRARWWFAWRVGLLWLDCWRLALAEALTSPDEPAPLHRQRGVSPPSPERFAMMLYHLRHAVRQLRREPAFTLAALLTLALGVGANAAVFGVVEALLLRPLPYAQADDLVILNHRDQRTGITKEFIAIGDFVDLSERQSAFERMAAYGTGESTITSEGEPFRVDALLAGPGFFDVLRVRPALGRALAPTDADSGAASVILIGHELWHTRFGGDSAILGRFLRIAQQDREVVGILPAGFGFPPNKRVDIVVPLPVPKVAPAGRKNGWTFAIARLRPGRTLASASTDLTAISRQLEQEYPQSNLASEYFALPLRTALLGDTRPAVLLLFGAVAVVLLIACANVANLLLARSLSRRREMAVRMALGAGRGRLAAQLLSESLVLSLAASVVGVAIAYWGAPRLARLLPQSGSVPMLADVRVNGAVLVFTLLVCVLTAVIFGLVGIVSVRSRNVFVALGAPTRATVSAGARRATSALVAIEVAFAIMLLIGAGLILRSFASLLAVDPGFRTADVATLEIQLPGDRYGSVASRDAFYRRAFEELRALPGVRDVGAGVVVPLTGNNWTVPLERADHPTPAGERPPEVGWQAASGGYFRALGIPLVAGRLFDEHEQPNSPPTVIVSEAVQRRYFAGESAVGKQVTLGEQTLEIVGVVGDIRRAGLADEPRADMYFPFERNPGGQITFFIRAADSPDVALTAASRVLRRLEPLALQLEARSLAEVASESVRVTRLVLLLLGLFAVVSLALAAVGIYSVMSYAVRQRSRELGTRIALGATRRDIVLMVLRQGATIAAIGIGVGLVVGLSASRALRSILYGVTPSDPVTIAASVLVLSLTVLAACYLPARRAAAVDPMRTLAEQ